MNTLRLIHDGDGTRPAADLERGVELLREVASGERESLLRFYRPAPTLAFGQRDTRLEGYEEARAAAERHGFAPLVRRAGGRAAAYHRGVLIVDQIEAEPEPMREHTARFERFGELFVDALAAVGVSARVAELEGEYCPGQHSVAGSPTSGVGGASVKLVGTAQRVVAGAWLFSSMVVVEDAAPLRAVTRDVYAALGLPLDPATVGAAQDLVPTGHGANVTVEAVRAAIEATWAAAGYRLER